MTPDAERAELAVAHCRHTAGATYGADRGACAICIVAILAAVREEATRAERERCVSAACEYVNRTFIINTDGLRAAIRGQEG